MALRTIPAGGLRKATQAEIANRTEGGVITAGNADLIAFGKMYFVGFSSVNRSGGNIIADQTIEQYGNAYNTATGVWTAPRQMRVRMAARVSATASNDSGLQFTKNGTVVKAVRAANTYYTTEEVIIYCAAGDQLAISTTATITGTAVSNMITIHEF